MSVVSCARVDSQRKRFVAVSTALLLCTLLAACGNDDQTADPSAATSNTRSTDTSAASNAPAVMVANPWAPPESASSPTALVTQSPASSAPDADAALTAAASAPLAPPVIHTVD